MAQRRMIDKRIIQTHNFLRLPLETQALYFHLMLNADDDGVVEAFPIVRMVGASEDNLGLLVVKRFIKPLNDEMVYFIIDFKDQNTVRKDMYKPSKYAELIDTPALEKEERNEPVTDTLQSHNVDKNRLDKIRLDKINNNIKSDKSDDIIPYSKIISYLNEKTNQDFRNVEGHKKHIRARWNEGANLEDFKTVIDNMVSNWTGTEYAQYLRPKTLFCTKFDDYRNQKPRAGVSPQKGLITSSTYTAEELEYDPADFAFLEEDKE